MGQLGARRYQPERGGTDGGLPVQQPAARRKPQEIFARKIAYNWWGGSLFFDYRSEIPWSEDGFVNYTIYRMAKDTYGEAYAKENYVDVWERDVELSQRQLLPAPPRIP